MSTYNAVTVYVFGSAGVAGHVEQVSMEGHARIVLPLAISSMTTVLHRIVEEVGSKLASQRNTAGDFAVSIEWFPSGADSREMSALRRPWLWRANEGEGRDVIEWDETISLKEIQDGF